MPDGEFYKVITLGKGKMGSYADKLAREDRWAVIAYVRALQRAQNAKLEDVPEEARKELSK
ncbi:MAG: cytochrome c [Planctomycetota bacterium]|nr:cytochrome c [Planctomycetota bacterium]